MTNNNDLICNSFALAFTMLQTEQVFQIISLVLTCISIALSLIFRLVETIKNWHNTKNITQEEVNELLEATQKTILQLKEKIKEYEEKEQNKNDKL